MDANNDSNLKALKAYLEKHRFEPMFGRVIYVLWKLSILDEEDISFKEFHEYKRNMLFEVETRRIMEQMSEAFERKMYRPQRSEDDQWI